MLWRDVVGLQSASHRVLGGLRCCFASKSEPRPQVGLGEPVLAEQASQMDAGKASQRRRAGCFVETSFYRRAVLTIASAANDKTRANMTFAPKWNWRSRSFVSVSIVFWLLFTAATVFLAATVIHQIVKGDSGSSMAGMVLVTCMAFGSLVWALGLSRLVGVSYHVHSEGPFLVWRELQFGKHRDKKLTFLRSYPLRLLAPQALATLCSSEPGPKRIDWVRCSQWKTSISFQSSSNNPTQNKRMRATGVPPVSIYEVRPIQYNASMDEAAYTAAVREVLDTLTDGALAQVQRCFAQIPASARAAVFDIFVDQDGEGFLDINVRLEGPDLTVLSRSIAGCSEIVTTRMGSAGFEPPFPMMDAFGDLPFSVHDTLTDTAEAWIREKLSGKLPLSSLPVRISSPDGYGTALPVRLT